MIESAVPPLRFPRVDRFEEWLHAPAPLESADPRFDSRRARPEEFDAIYDLVNRTFGFNRPRSFNEWLYRRNPRGLARCWITFDRASGQLVASLASWPWPMARGTDAMEGTQEGDAVVAPEWQRLGIDRLRSDAWRSHAWNATSVGMSWPNEKSRGAGQKRGRARRMVGPVPQAVMILDAGAYFSEHRWPTFARAIAGPIANAALRGLREVALRNRPVLVIERVHRFESSFDEITERCMSWPGFWSPHDADFLNWRYLTHPSAEYLAFALADGAKLAAYYVLKLEAPRSWLMEFVAPVSPRGIASALLRHVVSTAEAAGCTHIKFSAPPRWRHWRLFHAVGFLPLPSSIYFWPAGESPGLRDLDQWQWVPGDMDYL